MFDLDDSLAHDPVARGGCFVYDEMEWKTRAFSALGWGSRTRLPCWQVFFHLGFLCGHLIMDCVFPSLVGNSEGGGCVILISSLGELALLPNHCCCSGWAAEGPRWDLHVAVCLEGTRLAAVGKSWCTQRGLGLFPQPLIQTQCAGSWGSTSSTSVSFQPHFLSLKLSLLRTCPETHKIHILMRTLTDSNNNRSFF